MGITLGPAPKKGTATPDATPRPPCPNCGGSGLVDSPDTNSVRRCQCLVVRMIATRLGSLAGAKVPDDPSPLKTMLDEDLVISGPLHVIRGHLKIALGYRILADIQSIHPQRQFSFAVVTDEDLRSTYFGEAGAAGDHEAAKTRMRDVMSVDHHLVVLTTGYVAVRSTIMPGIIFEALRYREAKNVPTWVVEDELAPLRDGPCWSAQLGQYLDRQFRRVTITPESNP